MSSGWPLGSARPHCNWIHHAAFVRQASCLLAPRLVVLATACHSPQLQSLARSGIVAPNNSFKPKPLRGSVTSMWVLGRFRLNSGVRLGKTRHRVMASRQASTLAFPVVLPFDHFSYARQFFSGQRPLGSQHSRSRLGALTSRIHSPHLQFPRATGMFSPNNSFKPKLLRNSA